MKKPLCEAINLGKTFHGRKVVNQFSFHIYPGEILGLIGPNGAGKTTAFYMTIGLIRPDEGSVYFQGEDVTNLPVHKRAEKGMGYLAQEPSIFRDLTVEENLLCILEMLPISKKERFLRLEKHLEELHLKPLRKEKAVALSGGERRRLEISRSLIMSPSLLLLDEPFASVDPLAVQDLKKIIHHLKQKNISILITDHNAKELFSIVDRSYLLFEGKPLLCGTKEELLQNEEAKRLYFGHEFSL